LSLDNIVHWLLTYKYLVLFPVSVLEGPIVTVLAGFLASIGTFNFWVAFVVVVVGDIAGDILYYGLGRWGKNLIPRFGQYLGVTKQKLDIVERQFKNHPKKTLLFGKLSHAFGGIILVVSGVFRVEFWEFVYINIAGTIPKSLFLIIIGFYFGKAYKQIDRYINNTVFAIVGITLLLVAVYIIVSRLTKKYFQK